jgi:spermidine synthase
VFIASALVMVLEIAAGRLIAPYVGVSLYTWTSVIGVVLAGLSLGNWLGGRMADRGADQGAVGIVLALASLSSLAVLGLLTLVAPAIQANGLDLLTASFLYVLSLFFVPAVLLGIISPLITAIALRSDTRTGHVVGRMHALSALGGIAGTFASGYWLIQYFGTRSVILGCALLLFAIALPYAWRRQRTAVAATAAAAALLAGATEIRQGFANPCDEETQYYCIRVVDATAQVPFGQARAMVLDHLLHGINHRDRPQLLVAPYVHLMDELALAQLGERAGHARWFFAGGGAYTHPRALRLVAPEADITVAELDPQVTEAATRRLYLDTTGIRILHQDARIALQRLSSERFDVIVGDVFHDVVVPYHFTTREFAALVRERLSGDGIYVMNLVDAPGDPLLVKAIVKTLSREFAQVDVWLGEGGSAGQRNTYVVSASNADRLPAVLHARRGMPRSWSRITEPLLATGTPLASLPVLTDDHAPVERFVASLLTGRLGI